MTNKIFYEPYSGQYFKGNEDEIKEKWEAVVYETTKKLENVSKRGSILIPRGLSDEEVLKRYHDKETNEMINKRLRCEYYEDLWMKYYDILDIPRPSFIECDENGNLVCICGNDPYRGYRFP